MKFNKLLFWLGLRPLTGDILYNEYLRYVKKRVRDLFENEIVPALIMYGTYTKRSGLSKLEAGELEAMLTKAKLSYSTSMHSDGAYFSIWISDEVR